MVVLPSLDDLRLVVTGDRNWNDYRGLASILSSIDPPPVALAHGGARGADRMAGRWAKSIGIEPEVFEADWRPGGVFDKLAGHKRNARMLRQFAPSWVVAFKIGFDHSLRRGGTEHMVGIAREAGVPDSIIDWPVAA